MFLMIPPVNSCPFTVNVLSLILLFFLWFWLNWNIVLLLSLIFILFLLDWETSEIADRTLCKDWSCFKLYSQWKPHLVRGLHNMHGFEYFFYMSKIRIAGLVKWPVVKEGTKTKQQNRALKMSIFIILKSAFEFYFILSQGSTIQKIGLYHKINVCRVVSPTIRSGPGLWWSLCIDVIGFHMIIYVRSFKYILFYIYLAPYITHMPHKRFWQMRFVGSLWLSKCNS